jgi:hypothetical protein
MSESCDAAVNSRICKGISARAASISTRRGWRVTAFCVLAGKQRFFERHTVSCVF